MKRDSRQRSSCTSIILLDDQPLRSAATAEFQKLYKRYNQHLAELTHHEAKVRPAYYGWILGLFGERMAKLRQLQADFVKKSSLLQRMRELCIFEGFNRPTAFEFAHEEMEAEEAAEFDFDSDPIFDEDPAETSEAGGDDGSEGYNGRRWSEDTAEDLLGAIKRMAAQLDGEDRDREAEIKRYYRKLAQALHPDLIGEQTEYSTELWRETQAAYEKRDLEQLKLLWTLLMLQTDSLSRELRLFELRTAVTHMDIKLREVKKEKRRLSREDPSWGFEKKNRTSLAEEIRSDLNKEEYALKNAIDDLDDDLKTFSRPSGGARRHSERDEDLSFDY